MYAHAYPGMLDPNKSSVFRRENSLFYPLLNQFFPLKDRKRTIEALLLARELKKCHPAKDESEGFKEVKKQIQYTEKKIAYLEQLTKGNQHEEGLQL